MWQLQNTTCALQDNQIFAQMRRNISGKLLDTLPVALVDVLPLWHSIFVVETCVLPGAKNAIPDWRHVSLDQVLSVSDILFGMICRTQQFRHSCKLLCLTVQRVRIDRFSEQGTLPPRSGGIRNGTLDCSSWQNMLRVEH
uniref:(northern house mosquito) hypothetical protein n=1 Tax=Culex pipiens TaxID=7175 RepID=A0A8D8BNC8_CULPI